MASPLVTATWQAGALSALSNILGQAITCYKANQPFTLNTTDLFHFVLFALLSAPPNFLWQIWLEDRFPGYTPQDREPATDNKKTDERKPPQSRELTLNYRNTYRKFALDQTLGATVNTLAFLGGIALLRGESLEATTQVVRTNFWPVIWAGMKLWPAVSLAQFTLVPVQYRMVVGGVVGLFWGCYLSLLNAGR